MEKQELKKILKLHAKWLNNEPGRECADLNGADLRYAYLSGVDLRYADLSGVDLRYTNLSGINLRCANLSGADLRYADLNGANLRYADLSGVDLRYANLSGVDLSETDLSETDLSGANLSGANLIDTKLNEAENYRKGQILKDKIIGFKKCKGNVVVTLEIPKDAIVFGINGKYFRTNIAKCINISNDSKIAFSFFDNSFTYEVGKTYEIKDFDLMYNVEAGKGIHFFKTLEEAKNSY